MSASKQPEGAGEMTMCAWVTLSLRVLLGAWFTYSGGAKLWGSGLDVFVRDLGNYRLLPDAWVMPVAYLVPWTELLAGLLLMLGIWRRGAIVVMIGMVVGFIVFISWAWQQQLDISCGCQGDGEPIRYWFKAVELPTYLLVLAWLWLKGNTAPEIRADQVQKNQNMA